ncbi:MAG TPA: MgtC/SapB family protein, partial [Polyangiales bacterium]
MSNETYQSLPLLIDAATAIGIGLLIGLEREQHESSQRAQDAAEQSAPELLLGVRTFGLLALFGWVIAYASAEYAWLPVVGLVPASALIFIAAIRANGTQRGLTTEVAALITVVLGMIVRHQRSVAVAMGLLTTLLLISKPFFREFVPRMRRVDLIATLQLLILLAIVLPLLPEEARDPWGVLSPRRLGMFVALVAGIGYVGYVLHRVLGPRRSAA